MKTNVKKLLSLALSAAMTASMMNVTVADAAEITNLKIIGNPVMYDTVQADFDYDGDKSVLTYEWFYGDTADGATKPITTNPNEEPGKLTLWALDNYSTITQTIYPDSTATPVTVTPYAHPGMGDGFANRYVKVKVTDAEGNSYESDAVHVQKSYYAELKEGQEIPNARATSDPNYVFTVDGQEFVLLDTFENDPDGRYLVMSKGTYGSRRYFNADQGQKPYEMAYWLNNSFKENGNGGKKLPEAILNNIDYDRYWGIEQGTWWHAPGSYAGDGQSYRHMSIQGGIMLPAYTEFCDYAHIVGLHDTGANYWLRSPRAKDANGNAGDGNVVARIADTGTAITGSHGTGSVWDIRVIFALDDDFFNTVKVTNPGSKVVERIRTDVTAEELAAIGYSSSEIYTITTGKPVVEEVTMDGIFGYYNTIKGGYKLAEGITAEATGSWLVGDSENGTFTEIAKDGTYVTDTALTIMQGMVAEDNTNMPGTLLLLQTGRNYLGKYIKYAVTVDGVKYESKAEKVEETWGSYAKNTVDETYVANSPEENLFTVDGQEFILLDDTTSSDSRYFVLSKNNCGNLPITGGGQRMEDWAIYLNDTFKNSGSLPENIINNINYDQYWPVAPEYWGRSNNNLWYPAVKAGIFFLSNPEYIRYHEKIGYADGGSDWWLRDPAYELTTDGNGIMKVNAADGSNGWANRTNTALGLRPAFYLNDSFFENVKISAAGENAMNIILANSDEAALEELYGINYKALMTKKAGDAEYANVSMDGIYEYYQTIEADVDTNMTIDSISYKWMVADEEEGSYAEIEKDGTYVTDTSITLVQGATVGENPEYPGSMLLYSDKQTYAGKWLKLVVTINGTDYEAVPGKIGNNWMDVGAYTLNTADETYVANTPAVDTFTVGGKEFILLDTTTSSKSHFYLLMKESPAVWAIPDGQNLSTTMQWLNTTFKDAGYVPAEITEHINENHYWKVAPRYWGRTNDNIWNPAHKGGIGLLNRAEYIKYHEKIGYADAITSNWWLIDPSCGVNVDGGGILTVDVSNGNVSWGARSTNPIRPAVYVDEDFFLDEKLDLSTTGANVIAVLREEYTRNEMKAAGYSEEELAAYYDIQYTVDTIEVTGDAKMGGTLNVAYNYSGDAGTEVVKWLIADTADGEYTELARGTSVALVLDNTEKYVKAEIVTPGGKSFYSDAIYVESPYDESFEGTLSSVAIKGVPEIYQQLDVEWTSDNGVTAEDIIKIEWFIADSADGNYSLVNTAESLYTLSSYKNKYVKAVVTIRNRKAYETEAVALGGERWTTQVGTIENVENAQAITPVENIFTVDGQDFILLDKNSAGEYFVLSKNSVGNKNLYYCDSYGVAQSPVSIMAWLNNKASVKVFKDDRLEEVVAKDYTETGYLGNDAFIQLPEEILANINNNAFYKAETGRWWQVTDSMSSLSVQGGLSLLAQTELVKYADKIGFTDEGRNWWLRSAYGTGNDGNVMLAVSGIENGKTVGMHAATSFADIRPVFYLDKDFFKNVKVDFAGTEAAAVIKADVADADLKALYTDAELNNILGIDGVFATLVKGENTLTANITLTAFENEAIDLYFAAYGADKKLLGVNKASVTPVFTDGKYETSLSVDVAADENTTAKVLVWNEGLMAKADAVAPVERTDKKVTPYITIRAIGDSIVANYGAPVQAGWGEYIGEGFDKSVITSANYGVGGARATAGGTCYMTWDTSATQYQKFLNALQPQDYVLVQFGHNEWNQGIKTEEQMADYKAGLQAYVDMMEEKSSKDKLVFVTPPVMRFYNEDGSFRDELAVIAAAMIELAEENGIPVVDLHARTLEWIQTLTQDETWDYYMPTDYQHENHAGASLWASFITEELVRINHPLAEYVK